jgi:hypothetical protein
MGMPANDPVIVPIPRALLEDVWAAERAIAEARDLLDRAQDRAEHAAAIAAHTDAEAALERARLALARHVLREAASRA